MAELHIEKKQRSSALLLVIALVVIALAVWLLGRPRETRTDAAAPPVGRLQAPVTAPTALPGGVTSATHALAA